MGKASTVGAFKIHTILKDFLLYFRPFDGIVLLLTDRVDNEDLLVGGEKQMATPLLCESCDSTTKEHVVT